MEMTELTKITVRDDIFLAIHLAVALHSHLLGALTRQGLQMCVWF